MCKYSQIYHLPKFNFRCYIYCVDGGHSRQEERPLSRIPPRKAGANPRGWKKERIGGGGIAYYRYNPSQGSKIWTELGRGRKYFDWNEIERAERREVDPETLSSLYTPLYPVRKTHRFG
jgi:hypothetical protein